VNNSAVFLGILDGPTLATVQLVTATSLTNDSITSPF
jgi:hypothetical protein